MALENWTLFCLIALAATATPGPAVLLVMSHSLRFGPAKAAGTVFGNATGLFLMSLLSVLGLSAVILHSSALFLAVKLCGAAYLFYMGVKLWSHGIRYEAFSSSKSGARSALGLYFQGTLVALTNPKAIIFTTALFPQFIDGAKPLASQFAILVTSFMAISACCLLSYAVGVHKAKSMSPAVGGRGLGRLFGAAFLGAGAWLAATTKWTA